jgi:hypothetical protein
MGLNREELAGVRREHLARLKELTDLCEALRRQIAAKPSRELAEKLRMHQKSLRDKTEDASIYAAMGRAFLRQNIHHRPWNCESKRGRTTHLVPRFNLPSFQPTSPAP